MENPIFQTLITKLKATKHGNQWLAKCPAHDDRQASLSVSQARDGVILVKCFAGCEAERIVDAVGLKMADLFPPKERQPKREIVAWYDYRDEQGTLLFQAVRFSPKSFSQRQPDGQGSWMYNLRGVRRVLYRLPELLAADPQRSVFLCEGEKDADLLWKKGLVATTNPMGAGKWRDEYAEPLIGREVIILPDNDEPGRNHAEAIAASLQGKAAAVKVIELPGLPPKGDVTDWFNAGGDAEALCVLAENAAAWTPRAEGDQPPEDEKKPAKSSRTSFVDLVLEKAKLFHNSDSQPFASITINDHVETYSMDSRLFRLWMSGFHFKEKSAALSSDAEKELLRTLQAEALYNGEEREVSLRLAEYEGKLYLDLADREWRVVEISSEGWKVLPSKEAPVWFVRRLAMLPLPEPLPDGKIDELRNFMNVGDDATWALVASWLVMTLHPTGPYPILSVTGEQGSAKTTACKILRSLVDPNRADLRAVPKDERDLMIAANNSWIMAFDNLSGLTQELSDSLCRLATGAGFATRTLHSNDEETIFSVKRPILSNGIIDANGYPDLLDRTVSVFLRAIPDSKRREEHELWSGFNQAKPRILGALLTGVSHAMKHRESVTLTHRPRMADFARWAVAAEEGIGLTKGAFFEAYESNRSSSNEMALDNPIAVEIQAFMESLTATVWLGTATDLFKALNSMVANRGEVAKEKYGWPKSACSLSGKLRRLAPNLRRVGIEIECGRTNGGSKLRIEKTQIGSVQLGEKERHCVTFEEKWQ